MVTIKSILDEAKGFVTDNKTALMVGGAGAAAGAVLGAGALTLISRKKTRKRRKSKARNKRKRSSKHANKRKVKHSKRTSHRKIRTTKNGQPYVILANGRARFIKKSSARQSRKRKGGRY